MTGSAPAPVRPVAVVSGGSRGLGAVLVERLLSDGWRVATFSRTGGEFVDRTAAAAPDAFLWEQADLADPAALRRFTGSVLRRYGRVDLLVNNAAVLPGPELFLTTSPDRIAAGITTNLTGPLVLTQACARAMSRTGGGQIVTISSINALRGFRGVAVYAAAKAGLDGVTRALARELGPLGIRVNSVVPGFFDSDLTTDVTDTDRARIERRTPLGRVATVHEIADAVSFVVSPQASFITGQSIVIDGGITC
ncbi:SDR family oxidoreductase [Streptomyces sp. CSDS2]|uniref:SDR family NAD(P)-dependent oxidoreductase n=1 Tax=Streptomyces sp. CSDS2 TaxID=3055051 RepID=UPI0025B02E6B|nr:SDR family oxidoreductase [Streptomyces sp. CSDS2]MDN3260902.1 SDR family oxidoreductase [Streptomyces sp. CSDS2]